MEINPLPAVVSADGPLIHLAQINKLYLLKKLFKQVIITPNVKREAVDEGIKLGHSDAQIIGKAIEEGWIIVKDFPRRLASASKRLAEDENILKADAETLLFAREKKAQVLVDEKALSNLARMFGLKTWNTWTVMLESLRMGYIEVSDIKAAIKELGEKRHKLKKEQAEQILEAAKLIARKPRKRNMEHTKSISLTTEKYTKIGDF
jgi:predicted nucleic acid-binding protein